MPAKATALHESVWEKDDGAGFVVITTGDWRKVSRRPFDAGFIDAQKDFQYFHNVKQRDTLTISQIGESVLPKWWRDASGMQKGGVVEVRLLHDGLNSLVLTPKRSSPRGMSGEKVLQLMQKCPYPISAPARHILPFK